MDKACTTNVREMQYIQDFDGKFRRKEFIRKTDVSLIIILKCILDKQDWVV
jgi:hypothetical protein